MIDQTARVEPDEEGGGSSFFKYIPLIFWQRRWWVVVPIVLGTLIGGAVSLMFPPRYESSATLLIESRGVLPQAGAANDSSEIARRLQRVRQKIFSRPVLEALVRDHYSGGQPVSEETGAELVLLIRNNTTIEAAGEDPAPMQGMGTNNLAFTMTYADRYPLRTYAVLETFVQRFLALEAAEAGQQARGSVEALSTQSSGVQEQLSAVEQQITAIKARNGSALAAAAGGGLAGGGSSANTFAAQTAGLQRDNSVLRAQLETPERDPAVVAAEGQLATVLATYRDSHPDVALARQRLQIAQRMATTTRTPAASQLEAQIAANERQIAALESAQIKEAQRNASVASVQARAPLVLEQVTQLENRAEMLRQQLQDVSSRLLAARSLAGTEMGGKGERLVVIEPPTLPDTPVTPPRALLFLGAVAASIGAGLGLALLIELVTKPIRGVEQVRKITGAEPLIVVPTLRAQPPLPTRIRASFQRGIFRRARRRSSARVTADA